VSLPEILGLVFLTLTLLASACWASGHCNRHARQRECLTEISLVILSLIQEVQLHRVLSGALLDKRSDFRAELEANEYKLMRSLDSVGQRYGKRQPIFHDQRWRIILGRWEALRSNWRSVTFETSVYAHSEVILGLIGILQSMAHANRKLLGDRYVRLIIDWPPMIEDLGRLRAMGLHLLGHHPTHEDQLQTDTIARQLNSARSRLRHIEISGVEQSLLLRTERVFHRVSWLLEGNAERYHPYTFYEEITAIIDDWHSLLRHNLQEASPNQASAQLTNGDHSSMLGIDLNPASIRSKSGRLVKAIRLRAG